MREAAANHGPAQTICTRRNFIQKCSLGTSWRVCMTAFVKSLPYAFATALIFSGLAFAQAPAGASGSCKDGTYTTASSKRGACSGHGGVKDWFADQKTAPSAGASTAQTPGAQNSAPARNPSIATAPS